jgi:hypothetical protein
MADEALDPQGTVEPEPDGGITVEVEAERDAPRMTDEQLAQHTTISDDEVARYNKDAQKRLRSYRAAMAEQRRRTDQFARDATTAANLADQLYRENQELKATIVRSDQALVAQALQRAEAQVAHAQTNYQAAIASNDPAQIAAANTELMRAVAEADRLKVLKSSTPTGTTASGPAPQPGAAPPPGAAPAPQPPPASARVQGWVAQNPWFNTDAEMTEYAMKQHNHLAVDGITEISNPDLYFRTIEDRMKEKFPDRFGVRPSESRTRPVAVTGATRSNASAVTTSADGRPVIRLTESQVRLAKRLGVTPEQYAEQVLKKEQATRERGMIQ